MKKVIVTVVAALSFSLYSPLAGPPRYSPPPASAGAVGGIDFNSAVAIDESYRAEFDRCDRDDVFEGQSLQGMRKCSGDKNRVKALLKFPNGAVFFESKLSLDIDGSQKACNAPGPADNCATWFKWSNLTGKAQYVDSDKYPFVVIPIAGLGGRDNKEFRKKTRIDKGDLGVVIYKDKVVPVFVADGGPNNKLGEGSAALLKALGEDRCLEWTADGHCHKYRDFSVPGGVLFFLFPKSSVKGLSPDNALDTVSREALRRFQELKRP
jgi:hypothetical protein